MKELDLRTARDNRVLFAKELLSWSGYGQFKNLFYVFVFAQVKDLTVHENQVRSAWEIETNLFPDEGMKKKLIRILSEPWSLLVDEKEQ